LESTLQRSGAGVFTIVGNAMACVGIQRSAGRFGDDRVG
jgi:hypothetical protein